MKHMKFKLITAISLLLFSIQMLDAQNCHISGQLQEVGSANKPIEAAEILVNDMDGHSIYDDFSDEKGKFAFSMSAGRYVMIYRQLGDVMRTDTVNIHADVDFGVIPLKLKEYTLKGVTITSQKRILSRKKDRLVYLVENSPFATGFSSRALFQNVPRIDPTSEELKIIGKSSVIVLINGHRINLEGSNLNNYLQNIPSDNVSKIELITSPSAEYDADGNSGVINIILKRPPIGFDGRVSAGYMQKTYAIFLEDASLSFSNQYLSLSYSVSKSDAKTKRKRNSAYEFSDYTRYSDLVGVNNYDILGQNLSGNLDFGNVNIGFFSSQNNSNNDTRSNSVVGTSTDNTLDVLSTTRGHNKYHMSTISPYVEWQLDSLGKKVTVNYSYINVGDDINQHYTSESDLSFSHSTNNYSFVVNTVNADANLPFNWLTFELGGKYSHFRTNSHSLFDIASGFLYRETINAFYADVNHSFGPLYVKAGVRYEHTKDEGLTIEGIKTNRKYANWFPFVNLSYNPNDDHSFSLGYSKHINRPSMNEVNPTRVYSDTYHYTEGNPSLKPSIMENLEFNYVFKGNLSVDLYYYHTSDGSMPLTKIVDENTEMRRPVNCVDIKTYGGNIGYNLSVHRFSLYTSLAAYYTSGTSYLAEVDDSDLKSLNTMVTANLSYNLKKLKFYAKYYRALPGLEEVYHTKSTDRFGLGCNVDLLKDKLQLSVSASDIFYGSRGRFHVDYADYKYRGMNDNDNRGFRIGLTYKFGSHKAKKSNVDIDNSETYRLPDIKK